MIFVKLIDLKNNYNIKKHKCDIVGSWAGYISNEGREMRDLKLPVTHNEIRKKIIFFDPILHPSVLMDKKMIINPCYGT